MNAVEISEAVSELFGQPMDAAEFPYAFLRAFGNKDATISRLKSGHTNKSDVAGVLQRGNIHLAVASDRSLTEVLAALRASAATTKHKAKFILATDGVRLEAEELGSGDPLSCSWEEFPDHFGMFLPLAGISTVREIRENTFDIRATAKLNKLYVALLTENPDWGTDKQRPALNQFFARLIFCYFAEDTGIMSDRGMFTDTVSKMSAHDSSNTHEVIGEVFRAMNTSHEARLPAEIPRWTHPFPYVNGGLFAGRTEVPRFSRTARAYLLQVGSLDWKQVNPDIFGSMIQAVADNEERGALGMHYTSVPNILKVLNPLFLDDLRTKLEEAGHNPRTLLNLRKRLAHIRVFDPACGSGNFLVIAYKEIRRIEHEINGRRGEPERRSDIPLTNFRGIEVRDFAAEIARLALVIAEFQCDELFRGQKEAIRDFLPLDDENWISCGNALRLNWQSTFPPTGTQVKLVGDDLFSTPLDQPEIDFDNAGGETYICGNPPYKGARKQSADEKSDLALVYEGDPAYKDVDYIAGWVLRASDYCRRAGASFAFVSTSSICQGEQVQLVWPRVWSNDQELFFAYTPFEWRNNAADNAGVVVTIVGVRPRSGGTKAIFEGLGRRTTENISPYLVAGPDVVVRTQQSPIATQLPRMIMGNMARDDGHLILSRDEAKRLATADPRASPFLLPLVGTQEIVSGVPRFALHLDEDERPEWSRISEIVQRVEQVRLFRSSSKAKTTRGYAANPWRFAQYCHRDEVAIALPSVVPDHRPYVTPVLIPAGVMVTNLAYIVYGYSLWLLALLSSRLHYVWATGVSGRLGSGVRYTPTVSYHTFPVPALSFEDVNRLSECAESILISREAAFPDTLDELYSPATMPVALRNAHDLNDEVVERIYIGRRFRNDTERLEKLFSIYIQMAGSEMRTGATRGART